MTNTIAPTGGQINNVDINHQGAALLLIEDEDFAPVEAGYEIK